MKNKRPVSFIKKYRMIAGLSQADVADRLGVTRAYINACELKEKCSRSFFDKLAAVFGNVDSYTLMGYKIFHEIPANDDEIRAVIKLLANIATDETLKENLNNL